MKTHNHGSVLRPLERLFMTPVANIPCQLSLLPSVG